MLTASGRWQRPVYDAVSHRVFGRDILARLNFDDRHGKLPVCTVDHEQIGPRVVVVVVEVEPAPRFFTVEAQDDSLVARTAHCHAGA